MRFLNVLELYDYEPARLALLSTFQFDPDYFERRVLRSPSLSRARRIAVFMDAREWRKLLRQEFSVRHLNRRYLVVPVGRARAGVFHPKLNVLMAESGARVMCGSNNLTRAGCSSNLELVSVVDVEEQEQREGLERLMVVAEAIAFFRHALDEAEEAVGKIARSWIEELVEECTWLQQSAPKGLVRKLKLLHSYEGSLWEGCLREIGDVPPRRVVALAPFYDGNSELVKRIAKTWPRAKIELVVQQNTTNLNVESLRRVKDRVALSELGDKTRRLHAKMLAWEGKAGAGCLMGSANLTCAAFDGSNVEAGLLMHEADDNLAALFDRQFDKRAIGYGEFEPGSDEPPAPIEPEAQALVVVAAIIQSDGLLRLTYEHGMARAPKEMRVALRMSNEELPRASLRVPVAKKGNELLQLPESVLSGAHESLLAYLLADVAGQRVESDPIWVVQEERLTFEPGEVDEHNKESLIEETGEGLAEYLEELGKREGAKAVVEYLQRTNIRFSEGGGGRQGVRTFRLQRHDPFRADTAPEWLLQSTAHGETLVEAIYDFADRHEHKRLRRHADRGNINGIDNFLDILVAIVRLLFIYHVRGIVPKSQVVGRLCKYIRIATDGIHEETDNSNGFLNTACQNLDQDRTLIKNVVSDKRFLEHLWAVLRIAQLARSEAPSGAPQPSRSLSELPSMVMLLRSTRNALGLRAPQALLIGEVLRGFNMLAEADINWLSEAGAG